MSLAQEDEIMKAIGLGMPYQWFNGSGCDHPRREAARKLPQALRDAGFEPDDRLMGLVKEVADSEGRYELTRTWQACSDVIRAHMERGNLDHAEWGAWVEYLFREYRPEVKEDFYGWTTDGGPRWVDGLG